MAIDKEPQLKSSIEEDKDKELKEKVANMAENFYRIRNQFEAYKKRIESQGRGGPKQLNEDHREIIGMERELIDAFRPLHDLRHAVGDEAEAIRNW